MADLKNQIAEITNLTEARETFAGFGTAAEDKERERANFETGSYADLQGELATAQTALDNATPGTDAAAAAQTAVDAAQKKFDRA